MEVVLAVKNLKTYFYTRKGVARAVDGVSFSLGRSEILGVVGESGCGKSVTALSILRIVPPPGRIVSGEVWLKDLNLLRLSARRMREIRGNRISMIFQEPLISLNPAFTIGNQLIEAMVIHRPVSKNEAWTRAVEMLRLVEIPEPERRMNDYPHQLSGGMRQRAMIAEALLLNPEILIADEPTTALDVTIQAQVLDILYRLTQEMGTAVILITHSLGLVAERARRVIVMYASKVVEEGPVENIFRDARHPYTRGLLRSIPVPGGRCGEDRRPLHEIRGLVPSLLDLPPGCAFHPRCDARKDVCMKETPPWLTVGQGHSLACWLYV
jgi:peptide/nickel transport system ATP-binding protein